MTLFLTSSPCDNNVPEGLDLPCIFDARNGFVENLRASVEPGAQLLIIASDPDAFAGNDEMAATFEAVSRRRKSNWRMSAYWTAGTPMMRRSLSRKAA